MTAVLDRALALAADRLEGVDDASHARAASLSSCAGPLDLKVALDPTAVRTPALELLSAELERLVTTPGGRLIVSCPPQEGKSEMAKHAVIRALQHNPGWRVAFTSYAEWLAARNAGEVRDIIKQHGTGAVDSLTGEPVEDKLGLSVDPDRSAESKWRLNGHRGGCIAKGVRSGLTGAPVDFLVCDDPLKDDQDASSQTIVGRLYNWWRTVVETRLAPGAPVLLIATRWDEDDLSGWIAKNDTDGEWRIVNIPAFADGKTPDALGRPAGEWLVSARNRTVAMWESIRKRVGARVFAAMYQGSPAPVEGGVFKGAWFDTWRLDELPAGCLPPVVVVDPADNEGTGDEAGIVVGCSQPATGRVFILADLSAAMTVARWARTALLACARFGAPTLAYEKSLANLKSRTLSAWRTLHEQALAMRSCDGDHDAALALLVRAVDGDSAREVIEMQLVEITLVVDEILALGKSGPRLVPITAKGSKTWRMQSIAPMFETGEAVMVGQHPDLEFQARTWQVGQDSPDRVDSLTHLCSFLSGRAAPATLSRSTGDRVPTSSAGLRAGRSSSRITRSTRR